MIQYGFQTERRVHQGTRLIVLEHQGWDQKAMNPALGRALDRVVTAPLQCGTETVFPHEELKAVLGDWHDYRRFNGREHVAVRSAFVPVDSALEKSKTGTILAPEQNDGVKEKSADANPWQPLVTAYARGGGPVDWALIHRKWGSADIFCCQIPLAGRISAHADGTNYDPVAERLFIWMLEGKVPEIAPQK